MKKVIRILAEKCVLIVLCLVLSSCEKDSELENGVENKSARNSKSPEENSPAEAALEKCKLDRSIEIGTNDPRKKPITLWDPKFDKDSQTEALPKGENLIVKIFPISVNYTGTRSIELDDIGASIKPIDSDGNEGQGVGFSEIYGLTFNFKADNFSENNTYFYSTILAGEKNATTGSEPDMTEVVLVIENKKLLSLQMTFPKFRNSGENETLCLKSATVR